MSYKKFTKNISILIVTQLITTVSSIATLPVITKILGAKDYGIWGLLMATIGFAAPIALLGFPYTLLRFLPGEKDKKQLQDGIWSSLAIIFFISIIFSLVLLIFAGSISTFFGSPKILIQLLAIIVIFEFINMMLMGIFRAFEHIQQYCLFAIFNNLASTILIIIAIMQGYGLVGAVTAILLVRIILFLVMGGLIVRMVGFKIPQFLRLKEYLYFGLPNIFADIASWVTGSSDRYFISFFLGTVFVGYYAPAYALGSVIMYIMTPLTFLLPATLAKHYDSNEITDVKNYLKYSLKLFLFLAIPAFFGLSVLSKNLLITLSTYEIAEHSYFVIPIIALSTLLTAAFGISNHIASLQKKTYISGTIFGISALINFGLNVIFVPLFGLAGAAITTLLAYGFTSLATWHYCFKELRFEVDWSFIFKSILVSGAMSAFVFVINPAGLVKILGTIIIAVIIYFAGMLLLKGFGKNETAFLKTLFKH